MAATTRQPRKRSTKPYVEIAEVIAANAQAANDQLQRMTPPTPSDEDTMQAIADENTIEAQQQLDQLLQQQYEEATASQPALPTHTPEASVPIAAPEPTAAEIIKLHPTRVGKPGDLEFSESEAELLIGALRADAENLEAKKLGAYVALRWALPADVSVEELTTIAEAIRPVTNVGGRALDDMPHKEWIKHIRVLGGLLAKLRLYGAEGLTMAF
jgi:hypothetical protein